MNKKEQINKVIEKASEEIKPLIPEAYELVIEVQGYEFSNNAIPIIIQTAGWLSNKKRVPADTTIVSHSSPEQYIRTEKLIETIEPEISEIRIELYGKTEPLFPQDIDKALEWLKKRAKEEADFMRKKVNKFANEKFTLEREIKTKLKKFSDLTLRECSMSIEGNPSLPIPYRVGKRYRGTDYIFLWPGTSLALLEGRTGFISQRKNFEHRALIIYVLTGIKPLSVAYKIKRSISYGFEFFIPPRKGEFDNLYRKMLREHFTSPGYRLTEFHKELYRIVKEKGGVPEIGIVKYWKDIMRIVNEKYPGRYKNWRAPRNVYQTIMKRLQE